jgi:hypothetical protein
MALGVPKSILEIIVANRPLPRRKGIALGTACLDDISASRLVSQLPYISTPSSSSSQEYESWLSNYYWQYLQVVLDNEDRPARFLIRVSKRGYVPFAQG